MNDILLKNERNISTKNIFIRKNELDEKRVHLKALSFRAYVLYHKNIFIRKNKLDEKRVHLKTLSFRAYVLYHLKKDTS